MDLLQIVILALVQGLTEFLPISSSAHLILTPMLLGYEDQGLAFDVAVHVGSLLAVTTYFRHQLIEMFHDFSGSLRPGGQQTKNSMLAWKIILATLPIMLAGKLLYHYVEADLRSTLVIGLTTVLFGLLLFWADQKGKRERDEFDITWRESLLIGLFQTLALIPGTSRSGITMTAAMMIGLTREASSRFSFLLSIPTILMSGTLVSMELIATRAPIDWQSMVIGAFLSYCAAYLCIYFFLKLIERISMTPFVLYRLVLGGVLLGLLL